MRAVAPRIQRSKMLRLVAGAALTFGSIQTLHAQPAFTLERITERELRVLPGASVQHAIRIRNIGNELGAAEVTGSFHLMNRFDSAPYTMGQASEARCGALGANWWGGIRFFTSALAPGESVVCEWSVYRPAGSMNDTYLAWFDTESVSSPSALTLFGTLTDVSISTQRRSFSVDSNGIAHATVQLSMRNFGSQPVRGQVVGGCYDGDIPVLIEDGVGTESCGESSYSPTCFDFGYGFAVPALQPGEMYQCTFTARSRLAYTAPVGADFDSSPEQFSLGGHLLLDIDESNNLSGFRLEPQGEVPNPTTLNALHWLVSSVMVVLLGLFATRRLYKTPII